MRPSLLVCFLLLSTLLYEAQGMNRKLMSKTTSTSSTTTTSKNDHKNEENKAGPISGEEENFSVKPSPVSEHRKAAPEGYPDILDIAGMDYSPAKRKPPIHN